MAERQLTYVGVNYAIVRLFVLFGSRDCLDFPGKKILLLSFLGGREKL